MTAVLAGLTMTNVPPDRYERIQQSAEEQVGVGLTGNSGTVEDKGVELYYSYDGLSTLSINILKVPTIFGHDIISPDTVIKKIQTAIAEIA